MKQTDIIDNSKLIAEFMGEFNVHEVDGRYICNNCRHEYSAMLGDDEVPMIHVECKPDIVELAEYHESWDWLMPVVEKINIMDDYRYSVFIKSADAEVFDNQKNRTVVDKSCIYDPDELIKSVYQAVVAFIKWYNKNK